MSRSIVAGAFAAALTLTACGGSDDPGTTTTVAESGAAPSGVFNDADVSFAQGMIPHHAQAVDMAKLAEGRSTNPAILDIAVRIQGAQEPEIQQMRGWLTTWEMPEMADDMDGMEGMAMDGTMDDEQMSALADASGPAFDALFVEMMIEHHEGAIAMAKTLIADGADPEVNALAEAVISAQEAEITEMKALDLGS